MISPSGSNKSPDHVLSFPLLGLLAIGAGAIYPLAFAPFHWFPLLLVSVALFWWLLNRASSHWVLLAWMYGLGKYGVGISWVYVSIHQYGGASPLLAGFLVTAFVALMALFCLPIGWFVGALLSSGKRLGRGVLAMAFVAAWLRDGVAAYMVSYWLSLAVCWACDARHAITGVCARVWGAGCEPAGSTG